MDTLGHIKDLLKPEYFKVSQTKKTVDFSPKELIETASKKPIEDLQENSIFK